jgi:hypothetical protein
MFKLQTIFRKQFCSNKKGKGHPITGYQGLKGEVEV